MKKRIIGVFSLFLLLLTGNAQDRTLFNEDWYFSKVEPAQVDTNLNYKHIKQWLLPTGNDFVNGEKAVRPKGNLSGGKFAAKNFNDSKWRKLDLPHDWGIEGPFVQEYPGETAKLPWFGVAWYRKHFTLDPKDKGKEIYLDLDGAMSFSSVWCNGKFVGGWPYGYASYRVDLTPYLEWGKENVIAIRLDNPQESSRWYPGGGIYRNVWLTKANPIHVAQWGTFIKNKEVNDDVATLDLSIDVVNNTKKATQIKVETEVFELDKDGQATGVPVDVVSTPLKLNISDNQVNQVLTVKNPKLWDIDAPNRYVAITTLKDGDKTLETYSTPFGIRTFEFTTNDGFHLNGRRVRLQGVCMHHDLGALGGAFNYRGQERQLEILKEMGVNAIRTSHNPPAPEMLELCDKMGFVVIDEAIDTWIIPKKKNGYALLFNDWHERDMRSYIRRDRNHPSIIMWSTGNEVGEQGTKEGIDVSNMLTQIVHEEDDSRPATIGCDNPNAPFNGFEATTDIFGFNYKPHLYQKFEKERPNIPFYGSETESAISTRGEYMFPVTDKQSDGKIGFHMSSYDLYAVPWGCIPDVEFKAQEMAPASAGQFVWTGFDYLGEPTPFTGDMTVLTNYHDPVERAKAQKQLEEFGKIVVPSRSSYFGIVDLAGFKKDRFYIYQAHWRPELPMVHILPHWTWPDRVGQVTPIHVYTSGDAAELFINGKSQGMRNKEQYQYRLRWDSVVYEPGEVRVVAYKDGKKWAEERIQTASEPVKFTLDPDRKAMQADGSDLIYVTVKVEDENGFFVPNADNLINFSVSGPAEIVATDNGDPTSHELFQNKHVKAFNGMCLVILKSVKGKTGEIELNATSDGLKTTSIKLEAK